MQKSRNEKSVIKPKHHPRVSTFNPDPIELPISGISIAIKGGNRYKSNLLSLDMCKETYIRYSCDHSRCHLGGLGGCDCLNSVWYRTVKRRCIACVKSEMEIKEKVAKAGKRMKESRMMIGEMKEGGTSGERKSGDGRRRKVGTDEHVEGDDGGDGDTEREGDTGEEDGDEEDDDWDFSGDAEAEDEDDGEERRSAGNQTTDDSDDNGNYDSDGTTTSTSSVVTVFRSGKPVISRAMTTIAP